MEISKVTRSFLILSALCSFLLFTRLFKTGHTLMLGLAWNLFLAWLPLGFALIARKLKENLFFAFFFGGLWLLFFPNSPYIITDLVHLQYLNQDIWWYDTLVIFLTAFTGLIVGIYSIQVIHTLFNRQFGKIIGWLLVFGSMMLSGFGIYLGRFSRLNSWDILYQPTHLVRTCIQDLQNPLAMKTTLLFGFVLSVLYVAYHTIFFYENEFEKNIEKF